MALDTTRARTRGVRRGWFPTGEPVLAQQRAAASASAARGAPVAMAAVDARCARGLRAKQDGGGGAHARVWERAAWSRTGPCCV